MLTISLVPEYRWHIIAIKSDNSFPFRQTTVKNYRFLLLPQWSADTKDTR